MWWLLGGSSLAPADVVACDSLPRLCAGGAVELCEFCVVRREGDKVKQYSLGRSGAPPLSSLSSHRALSNDINMCLCFCVRTSVCMWGNSVRKNVCRDVRLNVFSHRRWKCCTSCCFVTSSVPNWHHCSLAGWGYQSLYYQISFIHLDYHGVDVMRRKSAKYRFSRGEKRLLENIVSHHIWRNHMTDWTA